MSKMNEATEAGSAEFQPVMKLFASDESVTSMKAFGSLGLKVKEKVFAVDWKGSLVVKLPAARADELVEAKKAKKFDPGHGRPMKEWIAVAPGALDWKALAREARAFVAATAK